MREKYLNDAIIGNKNMLASFTKTGELLRIYQPTPDYRQFIDFFLTGVKINDSGLIYSHKDVNNLYNQNYIKNTNILYTEIFNTYFNLRIKQTDFVCMKEDVLVKKYTFVNENSIDLDVRFLIYSQLLSTDNNMISGRVSNHALTQYMHDYTVCIFSKDTIHKHQINNNQEHIASGIIKDKDYEGMSPDSSISYHIGILKPGEERTLQIMVYINDNKKISNLTAIEEEQDRIRKLDLDKEYSNVKSYWQKYVNSHKVINLKPTQNLYEEKIEEIYKRTILLYPLLINQQTGGISAAVEMDEGRQNSGRYSYCWTRDAVFITKAFDILKMEKETEKFYKVFCKNTQCKSGMWEQRFYTDGILAPCWGYQIDETASVVYGIYEHYQRTKDIKFLKDNLKMCEMAVQFLKQYVKDIIEKKYQMPVSYDIWEMKEGVHLYSIASIFAAFTSMLYMYKELSPTFENNRLKQQNIVKEKEELSKHQLELKKYVLENLCDAETKSFVRNTDDKRMDVSMMAAVVPFGMFSPKEKIVQNTVERINLTLRTYTGGYKRFEYDHYMQNNPWPITTLWMALYYIEIKEYTKARECFDFVVKSSTPHGFLAEQVNNETMESNWVIGLGWSHAMFIIVLEKLIELGIIS